MLLLSDLNFLSIWCFLFLTFCIACFVSYSEIVTCVFYSFFIFFLSTILLRVVEYFVVLVNCLLKRWAFSEFVVVWNLELLWVCVGFLLFSLAIIFQSLCVLLRWSQLSVRLPFQSCCLCSGIILLIFLFSGASCGSIGFCFRIVYLLSMTAFMFSGRSLCLLRNSP